MIKRMALFFLMVFCIFMVLALWFSPEDPFFFLYHKESYSMCKTSKVDDFRIALLASKKDSYYTKKEHMVGLSLVNPRTKEQVSLQVEDLTYNREVSLEGQVFYAVDLVVSLLVGMRDYEITYDQALLVVLYENKEEVQISLGEFYYIEKPKQASVSLLEMVATHADYHKLTVSGVYLELSQDKYKQIEIIDFVLGTSVARINPFYSKRIYSTVDYKDKVEDLLVLSQYDHLRRQDGSLSFVLRRNKSMGIYLPFTYLREDLALHRFYMKILYLYEGQVYESMIDDFPFIQQSSMVYTREDYDVYYPRVQHEEF